MLHYHVCRNQKGWVHALPRIRFQIMNTVNASTNFTGFQLHLGRSLRVIPPLVPSKLPTNLQDAAITATETIDRLLNDVANACDNLLHAKIQQSHHAHDTRNPDLNY